MKNKNKTEIVCLIFAIVATLAIVIIALTACNYDVIDLTYQYNYAYIKLQNGEVVEGRVESWRDYEDGEQLQVVINGVTYLTNSYNCTLIYDPKVLESEVAHVVNNSTDQLYFETSDYN